MQTLISYFDASESLKIKFGGLVRTNDTDRTKLVKFSSLIHLRHATSLITFLRSVLSIDFTYDHSFSV